MGTPTESITSADYRQLLAGQKQTRLAHVGTRRRNGAAPAAQPSANPGQFAAKDFPPAAAPKPRTPPCHSEGVKAMRSQISEFCMTYPKVAAVFSAANPTYCKAAKWFGAEDLLQIALCAWVKAYLPGVELMHPKNEGKAGFVEQAKKQLMGVEKGASDLLLQFDGLPDFWLELKVRPNRASKEQLAFLARQRGFGNLAAVAWSLPEAAGMVSEWRSGALAVG